MSDRAYAKAPAQQKTVLGSSAKSSLLQRTCACGQHTLAGGECEECRKKQEGTLQRAAIGSPPILQEVLRSQGQPLDAGTCAFMGPRFGHDFSRIPTYPSTAGVLQAKLAINQPGGEDEREADRIADQVLAAPADVATSGAPPRIQRFIGQAPGPADMAPASVDQVLASSGRPLDPALRQDMEQRFGHDFSQVRVHSGAAAEQSAREVNANAYTVGHNIVFGAGQFAPGTHQGRRLIAHELTHVVQQSGADGIRADPSNEKRGLSPVSHKLAHVVQQRQQPGPPMIHRQPATSSGAGATPSTYPVGLKVPAHPDAISGIHDWTIAYGAPGRATSHNAFDVGTFVMMQICTFDDTGAQRVYVYYTYDRTDEDEKYAVGPDSVWSFVMQHGGRITAHTRNTDQLPPGEAALDPRKLPAAPDAFREEPTLYYTAPTLPPYDVMAEAFGIGKYSMTAYLRRMPDGSLAVLYYVAENVISLFRKEYVVGPQWLGVFTEKIGGFMLIAEVAYPLEPGAVPSGYQAHSARYLAGIMHGDPERASEGIEAWKAAGKDPGWWFQVVLGYASAGVPEPPVGTPNLKIVPGGVGSRIPVPGAVEPIPAPVVSPRVTVSMGGARGAAAAAAEPLPITPPAPIPATPPRPGPQGVPGWNPNPVPVAPRVSPPSPIIVGATIGALSKVGGAQATAPVPRVPEEEEPRRRRCTVEEVAPKFGRYPCHSDFARTFSGTRREFRVTDPKGISVDFDAKRGEILYEVKTGYGWMLNPNLGPIWQNRRRQVLEEFHEQAWWQMAVAAECGYYLDWYFNSKTVAEYFNSLLEPPVKWKAFDCDRDSDHMW